MLPLMPPRAMRWAWAWKKTAPPSCSKATRSRVLGGKGAVGGRPERCAQTDPALGAYNLAGARLSLLDKGDRCDLACAASRRTAKQRGQFLDPNAPGYKPDYTRSAFLASTCSATT
jgi:cyanophycinase